MVSSADEAIAGFEHGKNGGSCLRAGDMLMDQDRFKSQVINTVAKRAANLCSNPDCGAITTGPSEEPLQSVTIGEAAHIFGARPGSARFDPNMSLSARGDATNAIWLCRNCHKLIDNDENRFPSGLLFEWRRTHEASVSERVGKAGALARERYLKRHLGEFTGLSYLAEQIIVDKPEYWEYKLTVEMLRVRAGPILKRWGFLQRGLYSKPINIVSLDESMAWFEARSAEMTANVRAFSGLLNSAFQSAWGPLGEVGSDVDIVTVCDLFADACASTLEWEERVQFAQFDSAFMPVRETLIGIGGGHLEEAAKLPAHLTHIFSDGDPSPGDHNLSLVFGLPDDWADRYLSAMQAAVEEAFL